MDKKLDEKIPLANEHTDKKLDEKIPLANEYLNKKFDETLPLANNLCNYDNKNIPYMINIHTCYNDIKLKGIIDYNRKDKPNKCGSFNELVFFSFPNTNFYYPLIILDDSSEENVLIALVEALQ